jgi:hypothetical protein
MVLTESETRQLQKGEVAVIMNSQSFRAMEFANKLPASLWDDDS